MNGENESMEEVDMDRGESDQELTGNQTDESHCMSHSLSRVVVPDTLHNMLCNVAGMTTLDRECA